MPRTRKDRNCAGANIKLCGDNLIAAKELKAKMELKHYTNMSDVINRIIEEWIDFKKQAA